MTAKQLDLAVVRRVPVRTCVGCRHKTSNSELLRLVVVAGRLRVDEQRRLPGRGAWLHPDADCLAAAERRRAFPRALRVSGNGDAHSVDAHGVRQYLEQRASQQDVGTSPRSDERQESRSTRHESAVKLKP